MKRTYKVVLPVEIDGRIYEYGSEIELDLDTATAYSHCLLPVDVAEESK